MFFTDKHKKYIAQLNDKIEFYNVEIKQLSSKYNNLQTQVDALLKLSYAKYGIKRDGTPKAKPGRRNKVVV
jgi:chaperonin cofactor prefoldin